MNIYTHLKLTQHYKWTIFHLNLKKKFFKAGVGGKPLFTMIPSSKYFWVFSLPPSIEAQDWSSGKLGSRPGLCCCYIEMLIAGTMRLHLRFWAFPLPATALTLDHRNRRGERSCVRLNWWAQEEEEPLPSLKRVFYNKLALHSAWKGHVILSVIV